VWIAKLHTADFDVTLLEVAVGHVERHVLAGRRDGALRPSSHGHGEQQGYGNSCGFHGSILHRGNRIGVCWCRFAPLLEVAGKQSH
jgi:hypothetical protein